MDMGMRLQQSRALVATRPRCALLGTHASPATRFSLRWRAVQLDETVSSPEQSTEESGFTTEDGSVSRLEERLAAAGIEAVGPSDLFDAQFNDTRTWTPLLALYYPFGCTLALFRMALWIGGIALDLPAWRNPSIIAGFLALLGVSITWRGEHNIPPACHILASNHVSVGDLLMLFGRPRRYAHLITPLLPRAVFATRNLPAILLPANKETYEALAAAAEASSGAVASSSGAEYGEAASAPSASGHNHNHHHAVNGAASHIVPPGSSMSHGSSGGASGSGRGRGNGRVRSSKQRLDREAAEAPVHLFPEGGMTNGKGMMAFSRGFTRFAAGVPVVPVALRVVSPFPQVGKHTLTSSFLANLFFFSWQPWTHIEATALEPVVLQPGESRSAFVQRVQEAIALELGAYVVPGLTIQQKRAMASDKSKDGRLRSGGKLC